MLRLVLLTIVALATSSPPIHHEFSQEIRAAPGTLSGEVVPESYKLSFRLESDFFNTTKFSGVTTIVINADNITTADHSFQIHAKNLEIISMVITVGGSATDATFSASDPETDLVTVVPKEKFISGETATLEITYNGELSTTSMVGLYLVTYIDEFKQTVHAVATQFEETHARTAFPCFDEPEMKAIFSLSVTYPKEYHVLSNTATPVTFAGDPTDSNLQTAAFGKTPIMSTYLVALTVSPWNCKTGGTTDNKITVQVCSEISAMDQSAKLALEVAPHILERMADFTNYNYTDIKKLTLAAVPEFAPGAMENWGLVTFKEVDLLWTEGESSEYYKQLVLAVITHELSHQWFGDLVTVEWWSSMFLNEGFATYFEYHVADMEQPDWELTKQFVIEQLQSALEIDSYNTTLPLSYDVTDPDYSSRTNDLSYNKGGSILRMVDNFLTRPNYQAGLADYIDQNKLDSVTPEILWQSFQAHLPASAPQKPPKDMPTIMENWTKKPGYPLLTVTSSGSDVIITQEQFLVSGEAEETQWYVPITYTTSADVTNFAKTSTQAWLSPSEDLTLTGVLEGADWIVLNNQQVGYYRVKYDQTLLDKISKALSSNISTIDEMSRAQLVDDQFNFAKAGISDYDDVFKFLSFLKDDDSYYSWSSAFNNFDYLLKRIARDDVRDALKKYIKEQMGTLLASVPSLQNTTDSHIDTLKQAMAHTWACKVDDQDCVDEAYNQFMTYTNYPLEKPDRNLRSIVYCNGLKHSKYIVNDFRFLWEQYGKTRIPSEQATILQALGCANDAANRVMYLSMVLTEPTIKLQDARYVFSSVYSNSAEGVTEVLNFIIDKHAELTEHFGSTSTVTSLISTIADLITSQAQIDKLNNFSKRLDLEPEITSAIVSGVATATRNLEAISKLEKTFVTFFDIASGSVSIGGNYLINLVCLLIGYVIFNF